MLRLSVAVLPAMSVAIVEIVFIPNAKETLAEKLISFGSLVLPVEVKDAATPLTSTEAIVV